MKAQDWEKIKAILPDAISLRPSQRASYLSRLSLDDDIRKEIESLLEQVEQSGDFMSLPAVAFFDRIIHEDGGKGGPVVGQQYGAYKVIDELGHGGMGAVYLAERNDGEFQQQVAIKLLRRELNSNIVRARFELERNIQARLGHPNIAKLIDAGSTEDGIPYIVMEHVEGEPIDLYCKNQSLTLVERLGLFIEICDAVSFAHRNLVVHRDIKPSNILIAKDGKPKLLDFGISKVLGDDPTGLGTVTKLGVMTPDYASPEQLRGESATTATDTYSLGVVLYEILTGQSPFANMKKRNGTNSLDTSDAPKPSSAATKNSSGQQADRVKKCPVSPGLLKGDIDNIVLKAIAESPDHRYPTVDAFSEDISRFLNGLPVSARRATLRYQAVKFYKRNKLAVMASILAMAAMVLGAGIAIWQAMVAQEQARLAVSSRQKAEFEAKRAKKESEKADKITEFIAKMMSYASPRYGAAGQKTKGETRMIDVLNETRNRIEAEFPDQKDIQAELHHKFAEVYQNIAQASRSSESPEYKSALNKSAFHAKRALELRRQHYGTNHELVAKDMFFLWTVPEPGRSDRPEILANAIHMMRRTNEKNANFPHMLSAYANRLSDTSDPRKQEEYYRSIVPKSRQGIYEVAEQYHRESFKWLSFHFPNEAGPLALARCRIALDQALSGGGIDFENNREACEAGRTTYEFTAIEIAIEDMLKKIEQVRRKNRTSN